MSFSKNLITLSIFAVVAPTVFAEQSSSSIPVQTMDTIQVQAHPLVQTAADFAVADLMVDFHTSGKLWRWEAVTS